MKSFAFPGNIEPDILAIAAGQIPYMRTQWFSDLVLENESMLLDLLECPGGRVIPYTASGTAAMDACVCSFVSTCKRALVINGGDFGARWRDLCRYYGLPHDELVVSFGKHPDHASLEEHIASGRYDVLLMQHHETSSGYLYDLETVSKSCRTKGVYLVVDAISSFLTDTFSMSRFRIDIAILSSQKGLNLPPGLSFVVLSKGIVEQRKFVPKSFYYDWNDQLTNLQRGQTPFSPATHLFMQLHARLVKVRGVGVLKIIEQVKSRAISFRQACVERGWTFSAEQMSNCLTGVYLPFPVRPLVNFLNDRQIYVMPSGPANMIRVSHLGALDCNEQRRLVEEIELWEKGQKK